MATCTFRRGLFFFFVQRAPKARYASVLAITLRRKGAAAVGSRTRDLVLQQQNVTAAESVGSFARIVQNNKKKKVAREAAQNKEETESRKKKTS